MTTARTGTRTGTRPTTGTLLDATGIGKRFGSLTAVDRVDLSLGHGIVGVLGPNGAGKTTLLRILATVLAPDQGSLSLLGLDPASPAARTEARRRLGYLPQSPRLYGGFTPLEMVDYVAILKEQTDATRRRREACEVLEGVGLGDRMHKRIRTLSGGMQQRVALASALVGHPDLLVLDEPATGLDPEQRIALRSVLAQTAGRGCVVLSTHNTASSPARRRAGCGSRTSRSPRRCARG
jgi:ABC-2 type transport system ATP-binding protein